MLLAVPNQEHLSSPLVLDVPNLLVCNWGCFGWCSGYETKDEKAPQIKGLISALFTKKLHEPKAQKFIYAETEHGS